VEVVLEEMVQSVLEMEAMQALQTVVQAAAEAVEITTSQVILVELVAME
jgi:hypothetical protein